MPKLTGQCGKGEGRELTFRTPNVPSSHHDTCAPAIPECSELRSGTCKLDGEACIVLEETKAGVNHINLPR